MCARTRAHRPQVDPARAQRLGPSPHRSTGNSLSLPAPYVTLPHTILTGAAEFGTGLDTSELSWRYSASLIEFPHPATGLIRGGLTRDRKATMGSAAGLFGRRSGARLRPIPSASVHRVTPRKPLSGCILHRHDHAAGSSAVFLSSNPGFLKFPHCFCRNTSLECPQTNTEQGRLGDFRRVQWRPARDSLTTGRNRFGILDVSKHPSHRSAADDVPSAICLPPIARVAPPQLPADQHTRRQETGHGQGH